MTIILFNVDYVSLIKFLYLINHEYQNYKCYKSVKKRKLFFLSGKVVLPLNR